MFNVTNANSLNKTKQQQTKNKQRTETGIIKKKRERKLQERIEKKKIEFDGKCKQAEAIF